MNGHTISGDACGNCHGIRNGNPTTGYDKVTIKGPGTISGFEQGIRSEKSNKFKIKNLTLTNQISSSSIDILGGKDVKIEKVTIIIPITAGPAVEGIRLMSVEKVKVKDVSVTGGEVGVNFGCAPCPDPGGPTNGVIENSTFSGNGNGIFLADTTDAKVRNNVVTNSGGTGIIVGLNITLPLPTGPLPFGPVSNVKLSKNTVTGSGGSGILLGGATDSKVSKNVSTGNSRNGIVLINSSDNKVEKNEFNGNTLFGIDDDSASGANSYKKNECTGNDAPSSPAGLCEEEDEDEDSEDDDSSDDDSSDDDSDG